MKKLGLVLSMSSLMVMLAVVPALGAGTGPLDHKIQADIPFDFMVGDKTFSAGTYTFTEPTITLGTLLIRSLDSHESVLVITQSVQENLTPSDETKLVFTRYGDQYFLAQVWTVGEVSGLKLRKSSTESEVANNFSRQMLALAG